MLQFHEKISLRLPGAGTIKLDMASSLIELSVGGGGHTKLSIISTFRPLANAEMTGGSVIKKFIFGIKNTYFVFWNF